MGLTVDPITREARATSPTEHTNELAGAAQVPSSFGVDANGELYVVNHEGRIYRIDSTDPTVPGVPTPPGPVDPDANTRRRTGPSIGQARGR